VVYQKVIDKLQAMEGVDIRGLERFLKQEIQHGQILERCIVDCGGDPNERMPSQKLVEVQSQAFENIVDGTDDPAMLLHVLHDAELEESASWQLLVQLCRQVKMNGYLSKFRKAQDEEREHLKGIRQLVTSMAKKELRIVEVHP
jgi:hypothetical protein